jgi:Mitochondrial biogenesis AIM24
MNITPTISPSLSLAHWGATDITGRGLLALSGVGTIYSISLRQGETFIAHPSQILAYSTSSPIATPPTPKPYRFKSSTVKFTIPLSLGNWFPSSRFVLALKDSTTYKAISNFLLRLRIWSRRTLWGDRLFLRFEGPTTILMQSRGSRVRDVLTRDQVNEIADAPAGLALDVTGNTLKPAATTAPSVATQIPTPPKVSVASVGKDGKVSFEVKKEET